MRLIAPLAQRIVHLLAARGSNPLTIVLLHSLLGLLAARLIATPSYPLWLLAAALLLAKTVLDNVDGGLARATGQVTVMGRFFDTGMDSLVNLALFVALAAHGPLALSLLAYLVLMLLLSLDFNAERLYRELRADGALAATNRPGAPAWLIAPFRGLYEVVLAPQDRLIERLDRALFARLSAKQPTDAPQAWRLAWNDMFSTAALVNLGLSTQLSLLAVLLILGLPYFYVFGVFLQALYALGVQLVRAARFRRLVVEGG